MDQNQNSAPPPLLLKLPSGPIVNVPLISAIMRQGINEYAVFLAHTPGFSFKIDGTDLDALAQLGVIAAVEVSKPVDLAVG